jgi:hypothetical protein
MGGFRYFACERVEDAQRTISVAPFVSLFYARGSILTQETELF